MIDEFVKQFMEKREAMELKLKESGPSEYKDLVTLVIDSIESDVFKTPSSSNIVEIDHGDWQGTLVYVIGAGGYQPSSYWFVKVEYGSCSACDTLQAIGGYSDEPPTDDQVKDYMTLALHIIQQLKPMQ